nr:LuxR family transcriptional regulator [Mycobacterium sp. M26]
MTTIVSALTAPDTSGVVICGGAGVGKSRLAHEALASAETSGFDTRWVAGASSARQIPLGAFSAWTPSSATDTVHLVRGVIDALTGAGRNKRVALLVDDAHLLDDLSAFVVHQLVQRRAATVILTVRDDEPVSASVQEIWKAGRFTWLDLAPLTREQTVALLGATLGERVDAVAAEQLWRLTQGNALYLRTIVEQEVSDGRLTQSGSVWHWTGDPVLPPDLVGLIETRMGSLADPLGDVIDVLAVAEPLELAILTNLTDPAAIEEAETRNLIRVDGPGDGRVRVAHPLYSEVRRRKSPRTRLRRLRGMVATELAARGSDDIALLVRRAALSVESDLPPDADLLLTAARGAVWLADLHLAERLAAAAIDAGAGPEANLLRGHALSWLGQGQAAESVLAPLAGRELEDAVRARLAFLRASNTLWALGSPDDAGSIIEEVSDVATADGRNHIDAFRTVLFFATDRPASALAAAKTLEVENLPPVVGAEVAWALATIAADAGRADDAVSTAEAGYLAADRSLDAPHMRFNIADAHVAALALAGRLGDAIEVADRVRVAAAELPGAAQLLGPAVAGRALLAAGQLDAGVELLQQAVLGLSATHSSGWGHRYRIPLATALAMRGSLAEASTALATIDRGRRAFRQLDYEHSLAKAWLVANEGSVSEAITIARCAAVRARDDGRFAAEVLCLQTATQFGCHTGAARLAELTALVDGPRAAVAARFASALRAEDAAELVCVSEHFERIGDLVGAADAAAHAALVHRRQDRRGSALTCSSRAATLAQRCGTVVTPALSQAAAPVPFTNREREIVMLIRQRMTNPDIAKRLTLSVRTVESHIYRAMAKTGTSTREELAALLSDSHHDGSTSGRSAVLGY